MRKFNKNSIITALAATIAFGFAGPLAAFAATDPGLGAAASFSILGATSVTNTGVTTVSGDLGVSPGTSITNAGTLTVSGTTNNNNAAAIAAHSAVSAANGNMLGQGSPTVISPALDGQTLTPGVYDFGSGLLSGGVLHLNGQGIYILRASSDLTSSGSISLENGARACDVYWDVQTLATINGTSFAGTIIAGTGIHFGSGVTLNGRALALGGDVTMIGDTISGPTCAPITGTLHVVKLVVNDTHTAVPSDFNVHVKNSSNVEVGGGPFSGTSAPGKLYTLAAGTYKVSEDTNSLYAQTFTGTGCDSSGNVTLAAGEDKTCTVVNTDIAIQKAVPPLVGVGGSGRIVPMIGILKVPSPLALPAGPGPVVYGYTVWNVGGQQALTDVSVKGDTCSPIVLLSGDLNNNNKLDPHEIWKYSCTKTLSQTTTNTAVVTGYSDDSFHQPAIATAVATVVVGAPITPPLINIIKVPNRVTPFPAGGGNVTYLYAVTNPGTVAMNNVTVVDDKCGPVSYTSGDANSNGLLDPSETWAYTCNSNITVSTRNVATAEGRANGFTALGYAFATVLVSAPGLPNTGFSPVGTSIPWVVALLVGILAIVLTSVVVAMKKRKI